MSSQEAITADLRRLVQQTEPVNPIVEIQDVPATAKGKRQTRKRPATTSNNSTEPKNSAALELNHDAERWGIPKQNWKVKEKVIWLLYIVDMQSSYGEMSSGQIIETFNAEFKRARTLVIESIRKRLKEWQNEKKPFIGSNGTNPIKWFLTYEGIEMGEQLVAEAKVG